MKKLYIILFVISVTFSCTLEDSDDTWVVNAWYEGNEDFPFDVYDYIEAPQGWEALWGETLTFIATDPPGWKFVNWNTPSWYGYCEPKPLVHPDNPRMQVIYNDFYRMQPCNMPLRNINITPNFIKLN